MSKKFPINPAYHERVCWGCDHRCVANDMHCGNGSDRTLRPANCSQTTGGRGADLQPPLTRH